MISKRIFRRLVLVFIIFNASVTVTSAQQKELDSLFSVWQDDSKSDSIRIDAFNYYIGYGFVFAQPDTAIALAEQLITFSKKRNNRKGEAMGLNLQGLSNAEADYQKALSYYSRSLKISEEIESKKDISNVINNIGAIYNKIGNQPKAVECYTRSLKIKEEIGDKIGMANILSNIGNIFYEQGNYPKALEYINRSTKIFEEVGHKYGISVCLTFIGDIFEKQGNSSKALEYNNRGLKLAEEVGAKEIIANCLSSIGKITNNQGNTASALNYYNRSLKIQKEIGNKNGISENLKSIGNLYLKQGSPSKALDYCTQGLALAQELGILKTQKDNCQCLYDTYKVMGNGNEALVYLEKIRVIEDSLNSEETNKQLQQMEFAKQVLKDSIAQAETDRLVLEAHQEEMRVEEKTRNISLAGGAFILLLAGGLYARLRYVRKSKAIIEEEKDRSNNLLLNILPADIAEELKIHGKAKARDFDMVSILFTDFKGFTAASEKLNAQELVAEINTCFEAFDGIMGKYNIEKIKTIGDAYMAAGGLPVPTEDSIKNTVLASLEMQAFISKRKIELDAAGKPAFEMRVGVHTGPVVAGIVGVKKFQYDIWGDTVNTASRMESSGEVGRVNISQSTYELLKDDPQFTFESRGKIEAKGKGEIEMWFVSKN